MFDLEILFTFSIVIGIHFLVLYVVKNLRRKKMEQEGITL